MTAQKVRPKIENAGDIGVLIKKKRKQTGLTQIEAAGMCNVGVRFLSDLENGKQTLQIDKVIRSSRIFYCKKNP